MKEWFRIVARASANAAGSVGAFAAAILAVVIWGMTGPLYRFSDTWQCW